MLEAMAIVLLLVKAKPYYTVVFILLVFFLNISIDVAIVGDIYLLFPLVKRLLSHRHSLIICELIQWRISLDPNTIVMVLRITSEIKIGHIV